MKEQWQILTPDKETVRHLCEALKCHPVTAGVLVNRNLSSFADAQAFIHAALKNLRSPFGIKDMDRAVRRIHAAIVRKEKIHIFGDYDVDGISATVLLYEFLRAAGGLVDYYVPHRVSEGYGLREKHIHDYVAPNHYQLLITVDCGISSHKAAIAAKQAGIDLIITDHHQVPETLPDAFAVINPKRTDCTAGFDDAAGVGVVYFVLICLRKYLRDMGFWMDRPEPNLKNACDLVALGTVADIVPLTGENRILTKIGLEVINAGLRPGIQALLSAAAVRDPVASEDDISYRLAPRLNAAGRIDHAQCAIELLTTRDSAQARTIADTLNGMNAKRQSIEKDILKQIRDRLPLSYPDLTQRPAIILSDTRWHEGVLGIVAAKLADRYYRPVILISTRNGAGKGSARSIPGFNLYEGLKLTENYLESFGGHARAAGLSIKRENISGFTREFEAIVKAQTELSAFIPVLTIDQELSFDQISPRLADELEKLQPFGEGTPEPLFMSRNLKVTYSQLIGNAHRRMSLMQPGAKTDQVISAIQFNVDTGCAFPEYLEKIAYRLRWNRWNGKKTMQMLIEAICPKETA
ncbi:MAG: single-stranded-DNA-specific exonuclease RecJ [Desulfobacterales bacterium]|jgi:single-stranded-DNA-specific exonuclease|nr:single-stranded-DNA-specific exonuclease RecJ [Desulfobacterales bacterium]